MKAANEYETPGEDGQIMVDPPARELADLARANAALRASYDFCVLDVPAPVLAENARTEMLGLAERYTAALGASADKGTGDLVIATGHQPVLPHPGVWFKNHLVSHLAKQLDCAGINFIVDNDTVDLRTINVPAVVDGTPATANVPFIDCPSGTAAEEIAVPAESTPSLWGVRRKTGTGTSGANEVSEDVACPAFRQGRRYRLVPAGASDALAEVARLAGPALGDTMAGEFAAGVEASDFLPMFVSRLRRQIEQSFGVGNFELPVSMLAETDAFRAFCAHIIANAERFFEIYNGALDRYRAERGISNPVDPSPNLVRKSGKIELPFWTWHAGERRRPMFIDPADTTDPAAMLRAMAGSGLKVRPRALTMTMFFRLFCCDLFVHGIGGAHYEPVNDAIIREFFGVEPPGYAVASATLLLKPKLRAPAADEAAELRQKVRRMRSSPDRFVEEFLPGDSEADELARQRLALLDAPGLSKRERRAAYAESKTIAARLQERLAPHILAVEKQAEKSDAARSVAADRTWPFFLHSRAALTRLYGRIDTGP